MADQTFPSSTPISTNDRVFGFKDQAALWFSLGVGLLVMQAGAGLMPGLAPKSALLAILLGSVIGSVILALVARLGQETGLSSAALMTVAFGSRLGALPVIANVSEAGTSIAVDLAMHTSASVWGHSSCYRPSRLGMCSRPLH